MFIRRVAGDLIASAGVGGVFAGLTALGTGIGSYIKCSSVDTDYIKKQCFTFGCDMISWCSPYSLPHGPGSMQWPGCTTTVGGTDTHCGPSYTHVSYCDLSGLNGNATMSKDDCYGSFAVGYNTVLPYVGIATFAIAFTAVSLNHCAKPSVPDLSVNLLEEDPEAPPAPASPHRNALFSPSASAAASTANTQANDPTLAPGVLPSRASIS
jgi:hypothetical protein